MKLNKVIVRSLVAVLALAGVAAFATTLTVANVTSGTCTGNYPTIQSAINAASPGDTISVCPGTYNEQVQIGKTLIVQGAKHGVDARTRVATGESIINYAGGPVQIMADNVVLDGFTVQGSTLADPAFIAGIWTNPGFTGTQGGHQILNNIVQNNISGIELDSTCAHSTLVQHNLIQNNNNPGPGSGNGIQVSFGLCNATIDSNKFSGHKSSSVLVNSFSGSDTNITVSNNELVAGAAESIDFLGVTNSSITGNKSMGSTSSGTVDLFGGNNNITVTGNVLDNGQRGLFVENPYAIYSVSPNMNITAHNNCIVGNTVAGLEVSAASYTGTLNAESNWWGSSTGPTIASNPGGTGDKIIDPPPSVVDYTPFLTSSAGTPCAPPPVGPPTSANQCKNGGWQTFNTPRTFKNQGDCIQYVNTGK
jgi:hypothetical protein